MSMSKAFGPARATKQVPTGILHTLEGLPLPPFRINCSVPVPWRQAGAAEPKRPP